MTTNKTTGVTTLKKLNKENSVNVYDVSAYGSK